MEWRAFTTHVLLEARPSALNKHGIEDTPRDDHATRLTYSARSEDWSFSSKAKYARLRTPRGPRMGFRESSSTGFWCCRRQRFRRPRTTINSRLEVRPLLLIVIRLRPVARQCATRLSERSMRPLATAGQRHTPPSKIHRILYHIPLPPRNHPAPESAKSQQKT